MPHDPVLTRQNDESVWDWITWETRGNPSERFRKGDEYQWMGLWRADYNLLCKKGNAAGALASPHYDEDCLGRGWIKVYVLEEFDYTEHAGLIKTFLPCFSVALDGKVEDWLKGGGNLQGRANTAGKYVVFPYNFNDNTSSSRAIGTDLGSPTMRARGAERLRPKLRRWATASRSGIVALPASGVQYDGYLPSAAYTHGPNEPVWPFRARPSGVSADRDRTSWASNIWGDLDGERREATYQRTLESQDARELRFYSVKTGVEYVGEENQRGTSKDLLEENSAHAMHRSNLIARIRRSYRRDALEARYQLEILSVLMYLGNWDVEVGRTDDDEPITENVERWDGFQVREIGDSTGEVWFPALSIPTSGKTFARSWGHARSWKDFWKDTFAVKLGRAKAEMLAVFGLQHMTANAQNMLVVFDRTPNSGLVSRSNAKCITLRDIGDTILNDHFFAVLRNVDHEFASIWTKETASRWGVTLGSGIGQYFKPVITRLGTSIVFFFGPFMQGDANNAKILTEWSIAHNDAFRAYMVESLGYARNWQGGPVPPLPETQGEFLRLLKAYAGYNKRTWQLYNGLVQDILALHCTQRWDMLDALEAAAANVRDGSRRDDIEEGKAIVDAHDMLLGADIQQFIRSDGGKDALRALHRRLKGG